MALLDSTGAVVTSYVYDDWGRSIIKAGSIANTLGTVQPFRYRGYVYDEEIGMYYLRSRYLCSGNCRFINADSKTITAPLLGASMYAYTRSNPVNMLDANGEDAIWIQERNSAKGFGHSGLMVQDSDGQWHYFFWGPASETLDKKLVMGTDTYCYLEPINTNGANLSDKNAVTAAIIGSSDTAPNAAARMAGQPDIITDVYYFEGDYTATFEYLDNLVRGPEAPADYQLITRNCLQQTVSALCESDWRFSQVIYGESEWVVPNSAVYKVRMLPRKKDAFPWKLVLYNAFLE